VRPARGGPAFDALAEAPTPGRTPGGDGRIPPRGAPAFCAPPGPGARPRAPLGGGGAGSRGGGEPAFRAPAGPAAAARLLPSGDAYYLLQGAHRELLVPDAQRRGGDRKSGA